MIGNSNTAIRNRVEKDDMASGLVINHKSFSLQFTKRLPGFYDRNLHVMQAVILDAL